MVKSAIVRIVDVCTRHPWWVIALALILSAVSADYAVRHFAIKTDINDLISGDLPWTKRAREFLNTFPQREILAVVDAPTPELVEQAATKLAEVLQGRADVIRAVRQPQSGSFFERFKRSLRDQRRYGGGPFAKVRYVEAEHTRPWQCRCGAWLQASAWSFDAVDVAGVIALAILNGLLATRFEWARNGFAFAIPIALWVGYRLSLQVEVTETTAIAARESTSEGPRGSG